MQADVEKIAAELRAGLESASKGAWQEGAGWVFIDPIEPERNPTHALRNLLRDVPDDELQANVKHIVAAQPKNIRALLDELDRLRGALVSVRGMLEVEYHDDGRIACVAHESGGLREMVRLLDATLARALSTQVEERE